MRRALLWLSTALFAELVRSQLPAYSWLARWLTLFESTGMFALLAWMLRGRHSWHDWIVGRWRRACVVLVGIALVLLTAAAFANIIGKAAFAALATRGTIVTSYAAVVFYAVQLVLDAGLTSLLAPALQGTSGQVAVGRIRMRMRLSRLVRYLALGSWVMATMLAFGIWGPVADHFLPFVTHPLHIGAASFSLADLLLFAGTLTLSIVAARVLRVLLQDGLARVSLPRGVPAAISTSVQYLVLFFGFLLAVLAAGVDVSRFTIVVSALGVGIGFGLQNVVNNFVSGLILLYERPILVGDTIEIGTGLLGAVTRIGVRSSTVRTADGAEVLVPNANLLSNNVVNWTHSDRQRRIEVAVGVAYGTEPKRVIEILIECVRQNPGVLATPAPAALFQGFGDSALNFSLRFWTANFDEWIQVRSEVHVAVYEALGRAGIEIPFPQRDVHVRTQDGAAVRAEVERPEAAGRPLPS
jgi:small-conductance mechanosensitive channel